MSEDKLVIYHNPQCSKSRETLQILEDNQCSAEVVEYLNQPPSAEELKRIISLLGISARDLIRSGEAVYAQTNLDDTDLDEDAIIDIMCQYPILIERPIVVQGNKAVIGRPPASVLEIIA